MIFFLKELFSLKLISEYALFIFYDHFWTGKSLGKENVRVISRRMLFMCVCNEISDDLSIFIRGSNEANLEKDSTVWWMKTVQKISYPYE